MPSLAWCGPEAKREAKEEAECEAEGKAKREAEEQAKREAEEKAKRAAEEKFKREAEEKAKRAARRGTRGASEPGRKERWWSASSSSGRSRHQPSLITSAFQHCTNRHRSLCCHATCKNVRCELIVHACTR